ncbi:hypothetical protein [Raineyella sp.]|uniref:CRISPR-associated protein Csb3 n=1 Tax=bioreactor metagenome TaxID=1076179 RepID=A0A644X7J9_9ZZZZ|nr:hypothetical protein [Raineyella sp.]MEA5153439.1 hypothetical protein [Raineyella sp.]
MKITLGGSPEVALWHFAMYGLGLILADQGARHVRGWWADEADARPCVSWSGQMDAAAAVRAHARTHSAPGSWVQLTVPHEGTVTGLFSPRIKPARSEESWDALEKARTQALDSPSLSHLDRLLIGALGEPAHWLCSGKENQPDRGATRWEMKTRNRGEEFVRHRLAPLARIVAERSDDQIRTGLAGASSDDELGKNSPSSRTATGLANPGPVDNAVAWCALWGIGLVPLVPQAARMSQTAGSWPRNKVHPRTMALPVFTRPTSLDMWRMTLASKDFDTAAFLDPSAATTTGSRARLREHGVAGIVRFPVRVGGSSSAPERMAQFGQIDSLASG